MRDSTKYLATVPSRAWQTNANVNDVAIERFFQSMTARGYADHSVRAYRVAVRDFVDYCRNMPVQKITQDNVLKWLSWLRRQGASAATVSSRFFSIKSFFAFLDSQGLLLKNPFAGLRMKTPQRKLPQCLTEEQAQKLVDAAGTIRNKALIQFLWDSGARCAEVRSITVQDIDWDANMVRVQGKGGRQRLVPLSQVAAVLIREYLAGRTTGWVFQQEELKQQGYVTKSQHRNLWSWIGRWRDGYYRDKTGHLCSEVKRITLGKLSEMTRAEAERKFRRLMPVLPQPPDANAHLSNHQIWRIISRTGLRAGILNVHPHSLRHSFASGLLERGADIAVISTLLGHSNINTTLVYARVSDNLVARTLERCHPRFRKEQPNGT